jgi:hypothetical protein
VTSVQDSWLENFITGVSTMTDGGAESFVATGRVVSPSSNVCGGVAGISEPDGGASLPRGMMAAIVTDVRKIAIPSSHTPRR